MQHCIMVHEALYDAWRFADTETFLIEHNNHLVRRLRAVGNCWFTYHRERHTSLPHYLCVQLYIVCDELRERRREYTMLLK